jgi:hypothetical protein
MGAEVASASFGEGLQDDRGNLLFMSHPTTEKIWKQK